MARKWITENRIRKFISRFARSLKLILSIAWSLKTRLRDLNQRKRRGVVRGELLRLMNRGDWKDTQSTSFLASRKSKGSGCGSRSKFLLPEAIHRFPRASRTSSPDKFRDTKNLCGCSPSSREETSTCSPCRFSGLPL